MNNTAAKIKKNKTFITGVLVLLILVAVAWVGVAVFAPSEGKDQPIQKDGHVNLTGELVCLPHKNTDGPQTLECAVGFKSGDDYYALKYDAQKVGTTPFNKPVEVEGTFRSENSDVYDMQGSITVERLEFK